MKSFINEEFLLTTEAARRLYHGCAEDMPVIDYHCHLSPADIYADKRFADIGEAWLADDHYKWRVMRANAVPEEYVSGKASVREKFMRFAALLPVAPRAETLLRLRRAARRVNGAGRLGLREREAAKPRRFRALADFRLQHPRALHDRRPRRRPALAQAARGRRKL